jgi:hypothetical protein
VGEGRWVGARFGSSEIEHARSPEPFFTLHSSPAQSKPHYTSNNTNTNTANSIMSTSTAKKNSCPICGGYGWVVCKQCRNYLPGVSEDCFICDGDGGCVCRCARKQAAAGGSSAPMVPPPASLSDDSFTESSSSDDAPEASASGEGEGELGEPTKKTEDKKRLPGGEANESAVAAAADCLACKKQKHAKPC